jgi:hypothetical protein
MNAPDWLIRHEGAFRPGLNAQTWHVTIDGEPLYRLFVAPAKGMHECAITQMNNGSRMDDGKTYPTIESAFAGGLDELREKLGW